MCYVRKYATLCGDMWHKNAYYALCMLSVGRGNSKGLCAYVITLCVMRQKNNDVTYDTQETLIQRLSQKEVPIGRDTTIINVRLLFAYVIDTGKYIQTFEFHSNTMLR